MPINIAALVSVARAAQAVRALGFDSEAVGRLDATLNQLDAVACGQGRPA